MQVDYILAQAEALAEASCTSLKKAVRAEVFIGHPSARYELDRAWRRWFGDRGPARVVGPTPAEVLVGFGHWYGSFIVGKSR